MALSSGGAKICCKSDLHQHLIINTVNNSTDLYLFVLTGDILPSQEDRIQLHCSMLQITFGVKGMYERYDE